MQRTTRPRREPFCLVALPFDTPAVNICSQHVVPHSATPVSALVVYYILGSIKEGMSPRLLLAAKHLKRKCALSPQRLTYWPMSVGTLVHVIKLYLCLIRYQEKYSKHAASLFSKKIFKYHLHISPRLLLQIQHSEKLL